MARLLVKRQGFVRGGERPGMVGPTAFFIRDRGLPGRGPKIIPPLAPGGLGGPGFFALKLDQQREILFRQARNEGERAVVAKLRAIQVLNKRTNPQVSREAERLGRMVAGSFIDRRQVPFPQGLRRRA